MAATMTKPAVPTLACDIGGRAENCVPDAILETAWKLDTLSDITPLFSFDVIG